MNVAVLREGTPADAALNPRGLAALDALLDDGIASGVFPGAAGLIARGGVVGWHAARGRSQILPSPRPVHHDTMYDLASLTKVLATLPAGLALASNGAFHLDDPVSRIVHEFAADGRDRITFRQLLAHTSGLPAWRALYLQASSREQMLEEICKTPLAAAPGDVVEYSDLGIILFGAALERLSGQRIDALAADAVVRPLGLTRTMYAPPRRLWDLCAATEAGHAYEREKVGDAGGSFPWREDVLVGEVHDGNAHYGMNGVAPHAGLFSTAWEVGTIARQWLQPGAVVDAGMAADATTDQRRGAEGYPRGLGWVLHHEGTFFDALGPRSFGHTGFTGTSLALDPDDDVLVVLLTNRVHLPGPNTKIIEFRRRFHEAVRGALR